ncbi:MAG: hydrogenase nickel incorporation protein HypB [Rhodospirillales bacterium]|jgi:hydrogenase nickel incorporation protein HypB
MCTVCGCGASASDHDHGHHHDHDHDHDHDHGHGHGHHHAPEQGRLLRIEMDILAENNRWAEMNRKSFREHQALALNLVSSPGSGKTTLLVKTIMMLKGKMGLAVIEGDQQTALDAERIEATGIPAHQVNTGKGCHLDAHMVRHALETLPLERNGVLFIENVGNLVCPAGFDLGEAAKVAVLSVTEGEDKPLKYPDMFRAASLMILNKTDLLPHLDFNVEKCIDYARRVHPGIGVIKLSARSGEGMEDWLAWIEAQRAMQRVAG